MFSNPNLLWLIALTLWTMVSLTIYKTVLYAKPLTFWGHVLMIPHWIIFWLLFTVTYLLYWLVQLGFDLLSKYGLVSIQFKD